MPAPATEPASATSTAPQTIAVAGDRLFTESLTSSQDGTIYIASYGSRTVYRATPGAATAEPWIQPIAAPYLGVLADDAAGTLWACVLPEGEQGKPPVKPSLIRAYDLSTGAVKADYPLLTAKGACNDIAMGADGTAYATDMENMEIVRLKPGATALEVWAGKGAFGKTGDLLDGISVVGDRVIVNTLNSNKLFAVPVSADGAAGAVVELKLDRAIEAPDGMRAFGPSSVLLIESGGAGRLSRVDLSGDTATVKTIKEGFPGGPVAVTVVGETAYVIEAQFAVGGKGPNAKTAPYAALAVPVGAP